MNGAVIWEGGRVLVGWLNGCMHVNDHLTIRHELGARSAPLYVRGVRKGGAVELSGRLLVACVHDGLHGEQQNLLGVRPKIDN